MPAAAARASSRRPRPAKRAACASPARVDEVKQLRRADARARRWSRRQTGRGRQAGQPPLHRGRLRHRVASSTSRCWSIARRGRVAFVVSTEGGMDIEEVAHETPEQIVTFSVDPATGIMPHHGRTRRQGAGPRRARSPRRPRKSIAKLYAAFVAKDMSMLEINPLIVTQGRPPALPRRQDLLRLQRALPPSGHRGAARHHRGGREGDRGLEARSRLHRARRHDRLHGQRRRPRHGDHGHHQALRRGAGELPRRRRRRLRGEGHRGLQDHHRRPEREGHPRQHLRRHHEVRRDRARRARRGEGGRPPGAARRAPRRHQRRAGQADHRESGLNVDFGRRPRRRGPEDRRRRSTACK